MPKICYVGTIQHNTQSTCMKWLKANNLHRIKTIATHSHMRFCNFSLLFFSGEKLCTHFKIFVQLFHFLYVRCVYSKKQRGKSVFPNIKALCIHWECENNCIRYAISKQKRIRDLKAQCYQISEGNRLGGGQGKIGQQENRAGWGYNLHQKYLLSHVFRLKLERRFSSKGTFSKRFPSIWYTVHWNVECKASRMLYPKVPRSSSIPPISIFFILVCISLNCKIQSEQLWIDSTLTAPVGNKSLKLSKVTQLRSMVDSVQVTIWAIACGLLFSVPFRLAEVNARRRQNASGSLLLNGG